MELSSPTFSVTTSVASEDIRKYSADAVGPYLTLIKSRGAAIGTNTAIQSGDNLGAIYGAGYDATATPVARNGSAILFTADAAPTAGSVPGRISLQTAASGSSSLTERLRIDDAGGTWSLGTIGYGPSGQGVCGAVTQITSIGTAVTLNKICGTVTTVSVAWTNLSAQGFVINDNTVSATDTIVTNQSSGTNGYIINANHIAAGSFSIIIFPLATGTEAVAFNYSVIKSQNN